MVAGGKKNCLPLRLRDTTFCISKGFLTLLVTAGIACGSLIVDPSELLIGDDKPHHVIFSCHEVIEDKLYLVEENVSIT